MEKNKTSLHVPLRVMQLSAFRYMVACSFLVLTVLSCVGCEKERNPWTLPGAHPDTWLQKSSDDFHGYVVLKNGAGACVKCHGHDLNGGKVKVSCVECHTQQTDLCIDCHGGFLPNDKSGAPPFGLRDEYEDSALAVGAHTAHLSGSKIAAAVACATCHIVPGFVLDSSHFDHSMTDPNRTIDSIAEIRWGGLSVINGNPVWSRTDRTCASVYCHGNFSGGNSTNKPVWTGSLQAECGSCHDIGANPSLLLWKHEFHVSTAGLQCRECHSSVVDSAGGIFNPALHVNGIVDTLTRDTTLCRTCHGGGTFSCTACHGGADNTTGAPPKGLRGELSTLTIPVGAHTAHLEGSPMSGGIPCSECHKVPVSISDAGHVGIDSIAEITWGPLANRPGSASWNRAAAKCTNTYCHGNFAGGTQTNAPQWNGINQAACGTCHDDGSQPAQLLWKHDVHVRLGGLKCGDCHSQVINNSGLFLRPELHVNGLIDTLTRDTALCNTCHGGGVQSCTLCHGGGDNQTGAPPTGLHGESVTSLRAVGAHTKHLTGGTTAASIPCDACHTVPTAMLDPGHLGPDSVAEITWHGLSNKNGGATWNRTANTCSGTYCHGNFQGGSNSNVPSWVGTNQAACGTCHDTGSQPSQLLWKHEFHITVAGLTCADCHSQVVDQAKNVLSTTLHVNGFIDTLVADTTKCVTCHGNGTQGCTICHGGVDNQTGAPPKGLRGELASSTRAVGAHTRHIGGGNMASGIACASCHTVPASVLEAGHLGIDSIAEITWSGISNKSGNAAWNRTSNTCGSTYCHGNFLGGKTANAPTWTSTNQAQCGSCHDVGAQPTLLMWKHDTHATLAQLNCVDCHSSVVDASLNIVNKDLHENGVVDTLTPNSAKCAKCHTSGVDQCIRCHGGTNSLNGDPPLGIRGETAITALAVGAHDKHLRGGSLSNGGACNDCHTVPSSIIAPSHLGVDSVAELVWGNYANRNGSAAWNRVSRTCASTYCHGNFSGGKTSNAPNWTGTNQAACGSCHDTGTNPSQLLGRHSLHAGQGIACYRCHSATVNSSNAIIGLSQHVDNVNTVSFWNGSGSYNPTTKRCTSPGGCHGNENW